MLKVVQNMINGITHAGNHTSEHSGSCSKFYFHGNLVCYADHVNKEFKLDSCGYTSSRSTSRILNDYARYFKDEGYELLSRE